MFCSSSATNGIKETLGFRQTFNISYSLGEHAINQTAPCVSVDDVETSALLVSFHYKLCTVAQYASFIIYMAV